MYIYIYLGNGEADVELSHTVTTRGPLTMYEAPWWL